MIDIMPVPTFPSDQVYPLREQLDMTQDEFARQLGVSYGLVSMWESGIRVPRGPAAILLSQMQAKAGLKILGKNSVPQLTH